MYPHIIRHLIVNQTHAFITKTKTKYETKQTQIAEAVLLLELPDVVHGIDKPCGRSDH